GYFLGLAETAGPALRGADDSQWSKRLEADLDNLRAALQLSREVDDPEIGLRLAGALFWFWVGHGYWSAGQQWLEPALARGESTFSIAASHRANALLGVGVLAASQGAKTRSREMLESCLALGRQWDDKRIIAGALMHLGALANQEGDYARAQ